MNNIPEMEPGKIPHRLTLKEDGTYIWSAAMDMDQLREGYRTGGRICDLCAFVLAVCGAVVYIYTRREEVLLSLTAFAACIWLITRGVVHGLMNWQGERRQTYRMSDVHLGCGSGRRSGYFEIAKAKTMILGENYIELRARIGAFRAYIPKEDYDFVEWYLRGRVPGDCEVIIRSENQQTR